MPQYFCCGINFDGEKDYVQHRQQIHGEDPKVKFSCCGIEFYTDEGYSEHRRKVHGGDNPAGKRSFLSKLFNRS